jgi:calcineurin-like phosphoesterase family protein
VQNIDKIFFTSDQHYGHYSSVARPPTKAWATNTRHQFGSVADMNAGMINAWNLIVPSDGEVYMLGDFVYNGHSQDDESVLRAVKSTLGKLVGTKHLIVGNHDLPFNDQNMAERYKEAGFETVIHGQTTIELANKAFELCHFPRWQGANTRSTHYPQKLNDWNSANWLLHGHSHSQVQLNLPNKMIDVGVDAWSFRPVSARTIVAMASAAEGHYSDHMLGRVAPNTYGVE